jgi:hypothetical protein
MKLMGRTVAILTAIDEFPPISRASGAEYTVV